MPEVEYKFHPARDWKFDFAWPSLSRLVALEVEGGHWIGGHGGTRYEKDLEKYNSAAAAGWRVIRVTPRQIGPIMLYALARVGIRPRRKPNEPKGVSDET